MLHGYLCRMSFFQDVKIRGAFGDLIAYLRAPGEYKPLIMLASCVPPALIVGAFYLDARDKATPGPPEVIYFESWPLTRTIEESRAANIKYQKIKDAQRAREKAAYMALGRATGIDVDKIDRELRAEEAADKAKAEAERAAVDKSSSAKAGAAK